MPIEGSADKEIKSLIASVIKEKDLASPEKVIRLDRVNLAKPNLEDLCHIYPGVNESQLSLDWAIARVLHKQLKGLEEMYDYPANKLHKQEVIAEQNAAIRVINSSYETVEATRILMSQTMMEYETSDKYYVGKTASNHVFAIGLYDDAYKADTCSWMIPACNVPGKTDIYIERYIRLRIIDASVDLLPSVRANHFKFLSKWYPPTTISRNRKTLGSVGVIIDNLLQHPNPYKNIHPALHSFLGHKWVSGAKRVDLATNDEVMVAWRITNFPPTR